MTPHRCAVPDCANDATGIFCPDHYIALPPKEAQWLVRWQIKTLRCEDGETKQHMREQLHGYTQQAIRTLQSQARSSSQAALDSARRSSPAAGANQQAHPNG